MPNRVFFNDNNPQDDFSAVEDHGSMVALLDRMNSSNMVSPATHDPNESFVSAGVEL